MTWPCRAPHDSRERRPAPRARAFLAVSLLAAALAPIAWGGTAAAAPLAQVSEFSTGLNAGGSPAGIAPGPDGNLWFTDRGSTKAIGRITPSGSITEFDQTNGLNAGSSPEGIAPGPDGNLWFTDFGTTKAIGRITPDGSITEFSTDAGSSPVFIAAGPDGNLWFTEQSATTRAIGRITTSGSITEFSTGLNAGSIPVGIAPGADGNLWFTDAGTTAAIGRIGTGAPAASQAPPEVAGSGQVGTRQSCLGDRWADWAGVPPSSSPFAFAGFDGYQWLLDGQPLAGKTARSYTPTAAQAALRSSRARRPGGGAPDNLAHRVAGRLLTNGRVYGPAAARRETAGRLRPR